MACFASCFQQSLQASLLKQCIGLFQSTLASRTCSWLCMPSESSDCQYSLSLIYISSRHVYDSYEQTVEMKRLNSSVSEVCCCDFTSIIVCQVGEDENVCILRFFFLSYNLLRYIPQWMIYFNISSFPSVLSFCCKGNSHPLPFLFF